MAEESKDGTDCAAGRVVAIGDRVKLKKWAAVALWSFDVGENKRVQKTLRLKLQTCLSHCDGVTCVHVGR